MAHFAQIDENNIVVKVLVVPDELEHRGEDYLVNDLGLGGTWIKTSYNTLNGQHKLGGTPLRGNFASIGCVYDPTFDVFSTPKPYPSWKMDYTNFKWTAPKPEPEFEEGFAWRWSEYNQEWVKVVL